MVIWNDLEWSMLSYYVIYLKISEKSCSKKRKKEALIWQTKPAKSPEQAPRHVQMAFTSYVIHSTDLDS